MSKKTKSKAKTAPIKGKKLLKKPKEAVEKKPVGRPTDYKDEYADQAYKICLLHNATDDELAEIYQVNVDTIYEWKKQHPEFSEAVRAGKDGADGEVVAKFKERACGFTWQEDVPIKVKSEFWKDGKKCSEEKVIITRVTRTVPPDTPAAINWLSNRQAKKWRNNSNVTITDNRDFEIPEDATPADAAAAYQDMIKKT